MPINTWIWRQIVTSQTANTKYKWLPYATEWNPPMKIFCVRHCAAYSVYYAQRQVSASLWNARAYTVVGGHTLKVYTDITLFLTWWLQSWHKGNYTASAHHHSLWQTAQCESHPVRGGTSSRCLPSWLSPKLKKKYANSDVLTMKMIRIIQYLHLFNMKGQILIQFI